MKTIHPAVAEHVIEENERLRGLLREYAGPYRARQPDELLERTDAALSQQPEPTDTYTAVDMATAAAQGFRDGQAAVEPAPAQGQPFFIEPCGAMLQAADDAFREEYGFPSALAQDELPAGGVTIEKDVFGTVHIKMGDFDYIQIQYQYPYTDNASQNVLAKSIAELLTLPAQTEQQPIQLSDDVREYLQEGINTATQGEECDDDYEFANGLARLLDPIYAAPIAQTAPQPEQSGLLEAAKAFADAARKNIYPCPDKPNSLSGKLQALDGAIAAALSAQGDKP